MSEGVCKRAEQLALGVLLHLQQIGGAILPARLDGRESGIDRREELPGLVAAQPEQGRRNGRMAAKYHGVDATGPAKSRVLLT